MRGVSWACVLSFLIFCLVFVLNGDESPSPPAGILFDRDIVYGKGGDVDLKLNLSRPDARGSNRPCETNDPAQNLKK